MLSARPPAEDWSSGCSGGGRGKEGERRGRRDAGTGRVKTAALATPDSPTGETSQHLSFLQSISPLSVRWHFLPQYYCISPEFLLQFWFECGRLCGGSEFWTRWLPAVGSSWRWSRRRCLPVLTNSLLLLKHLHPKIPKAPSQIPRLQL